MFGEKPEISDTLEWMLQSRQVGDETLVNTIVQQQYAHLYTFVSVITDSPDPAWVENLVQRVIIEAVEDTSEYSQNTRVEVWLYRKAYKLTKNTNSLKPFSGKSSPGILDDTGGEYSPLWGILDRLEANQRLVLVLKYQHGLTTYEIGYVTGLPEPEVDSLLHAADQELKVIDGGEGNTKNSQGDLQQAFIERWPAPGLNLREELLIAGRILQSLQKKETRKRRLITAGEVILVAVAIFILAVMGRVIATTRPALTPAGTVVHTQLVNQIVYITPTQGPTLPPTPFPEMAILYTANQGETLAEIGDRIFLNAEILSALNNIPADEELNHGQQVMIGVSDSRRIMATPIRATPEVLPTLPQNVPLTLNSSADEIRQRILGSRSNWESLWADAYIIQYGPPGYVGDADIRRQQIWISQPYFSYTLDGELSGEVIFITSALGGWINYINLITGEQLDNTETDLVHLHQDLQQLLMPSEFREDFNGDVEIIGVDEVAGRETLVFDWFSIDNIGELSNNEDSPERILQGRYWVDTNLGMILRCQKFNSNNIEQLFGEIIISKIEFNVDIPHRLYDRSQPLQTYFASDHRGEPSSEVDILPMQIYNAQLWRAPLDREPAPRDYDPTLRRLKFQWTSLSSFDTEQGTRADLFADQFFLSNIEFADPDQILCTRSADGNLIAFTNWSEDSRFGNVPLRWFSLSDLPTVHQVLPDVVPLDFTFAPDNRQLAIYGCEQQSGGSCGIYILDTQSLYVSKLTVFKRGGELVWNPDSNQIAIQGSLLRKGKWRVLVFDTQSGTILYDGPFDWEGYWVARESPIHDWGVEYPPVRGGLEVCSEPPEGG